MIEGEGFVQVHNKTSRIGKFGTIIIPLGMLIKSNARQSDYLKISFAGVEYSIVNISKEDPLILGYVKMPCINTSQGGS